MPAGAAVPALVRSGRRSPFSDGSAPRSFKVPHTREGIRQHGTAHKGLIPPLCAARCFLIPALVCDTREGRPPRRNEGRNLGERNGWVSREPRLPRARTLLDTHPWGLPGGQPATRLSLGGRRSAAVPLPLPAPLGPGGGASTDGGAVAPASASTPTWGAKGAAVPPGGPKRVWVSGVSGGFPDGCSKMRLSLGEITGIGPKPSNSDAKWNTSPPRRRNTAKPRRILDHYGTRTAPHHITATAEAATGPPRASGSSSAYSSMRESGSARRARAGPPASSNIFGTKRSAPRANGLYAGRARTTPP